MRRIHHAIRRVLIISMLPILLWASPGVVLAQSAAQRQMYELGIKYYNIAEDCTTTANGATSAGDITGGTSIWSSGLQPPFILEQFAIETLKDVAAKRGVNQDATVTEQHVIALVAFMIGEGGDINNGDLFNPLNTGLNAPELLATENAANGLQSFKSFDAGVEATARTIVGQNQSRLAAVLIDPASTAEQFMTALTYYNRYPGNAFWAEASTKDPQGYYNGRISLVNRVRGDYGNIASIVLGTSAHEEPDGIRQPSKLQFHPASDSGGGGSGPDTGSNASAGDLCGGTSSVGFVGFPLQTTKSSMSQHNPCLKNSTDGKMCRGEHPYAAYDIMADAGTPILSLLDGIVQGHYQDKCGGNMVSIYNATQDVVISYLHMGAVTAQDGASIQPGQVIGQVGDDAASCFTGTHLHIDAAPGKTRPGCTREDCPASSAKLFEQADAKLNLGKLLYDGYVKLPEGTPST